MCGIAGIYDTTCIETKEDAICKMLDTMKRRGPDEQGVYHDTGITLLHARLSIMDLQHGKQPMKRSDERQQYVLTYNGELYNTSDLRKQLIGLGHTFFEESDTEVLLHAYMEWREDCLTKLNGIFAFAIWCEEEKKLFIARDSVGVKPLFYTTKHDAFYFASELKILLAHPSIKAEINVLGIQELIYMGPGRTPGYGVFKDIFEVKPGEFIVVSKDGIETKRYHKLKDGKCLDSYSQTKERVQHMVENAIVSQLQADVDVAAFLSGGLDSSIICAIAAREFQKQGKQLNTFSVTYEENDKYFHTTKFQPNSDSYYIDCMQKHIQSNHTTIQLKTSDLVDALYEAVDARDLPGMADIDSSLLLFCKEVRKYAKVALSGECADEIFGGYPWYRDSEIRQLDGFPWAQNRKYREQFIHKDIQGIKVDYIDQAYRSALQSCDIIKEQNAQDKRIKELVNLNMDWFMQTLLDRKDRMSMYNGLEVRVPFCDINIVNYMYQVPWEYKDANGFEKGLLRDAMQYLLPQEVAWRKKSPYPKTFHPLYRELVSNQMREILASTNEPICSIIDRNALEMLLQDDQSQPWYGQLMNTPQTIAYFLQLNYWMKSYHVHVSI